MKIEIEKVFLAILVVIIALTIGFFGYALAGRATQENVITVMVENKETVHYSSCVLTGKGTVCTPHTSYVIYTDNGEMTTNTYIYNDIIVGKRHSFHVVGWNWDRYIDEVLE